MLSDTGACGTAPLQSLPLKESLRQFVRHPELVSGSKRDQWPKG